MKKKSSVSVFSSIKIKIELLVVVAVLVTAGLCMGIIIPFVQEKEIALVQNYMEDIVQVAGEGIDRAIEARGADNVLTAEALGGSVGGIGINGMDSSYTYVVAADSTMLYHPTAEKIGQLVENDAVKQLTGEIAKGNRPETDVISYVFNGVRKYASFYIGEDKDFIVVVTTDEDEILASNNMIMRRGMTGSVIILLLCSLAALVVAFRIVKPIEMITEMIAKLSDLDFTENGMQDYLNKRKDETGVMGRSMAALRNKLTSTVKTIIEHSGRLFEASVSMNRDTAEMAEAVDQVERAMGEIAQGATSQAEETQTATENVIVMGNMIEETNEEVETLRENASEMRVAGDEAIGIISDLNSINQQTKEAIQIIYDQTNTTNVSALKIREATDMISDIAEETNLLSLNASIEAARAGEQGRGFAVVASQIQKLAEQSNESASQIAGIINSLISDSEKSVETMEDVKRVIEKQNENVMNTESAFRKVKVGIDRSIDGIGAIAEKTRRLDEARIRVVDVVQNLTAIAQENAASTEETAASAAEVGAIITNIAGNARQLNDIASQMDENMKTFVVE